VTSRLLTLQQFLARRERMSKGKNKMVFTNGCFDLIHRGHIEYLREASRLGDFLVIGLNSDESVKRIKGPNRPLVNQEDRAIVLSALRFVDYVIIFEEDTPLRLIKAIKPDILVKGGDWKAEDIVGGDFVQSYGGRVLSLPYREGYSTTQLIERIIKLGKEQD